MSCKEHYLEGENARLRRLLQQAGIDAATNDVIDKLQKSLIAELHHRVKNLLSMVLVITNHSISNAANVRDAQEAVQSRVLAFSHSYDAIRDDGLGIKLAKIIETAIEPYVGDNRIGYEVPDVLITRTSASIPLSLVFNELCTNALKYGALSKLGGKVWIVGKLNDADHLSVTWTETGGPPVAPPTKRGFGTIMIEDAIPNCTSLISFDPAGVTCRMVIPINSISS